MTDAELEYLNLERWRELPIDGYYVSSHGRVRGKRGIMKQTPNDAGYMRVRLYECKTGKKPTCRVHRLVAGAFVLNPHELPEVHHKDHDTANNWFTNLQWCTRQQNIDYRYAEDRDAQVDAGNPSDYF